MSSDAAGFDGMDKLGGVLERIGVPKPEVRAAAYSLADSRSRPCDRCGGGRFLKYPARVHEPRFGQVYPCPECNQAPSGEMQVGEGLTGDERRQFRLERFLVPEDLPLEQKQSLHLGREYARIYSENPDQAPWLVITGPAGSGKTHLAVGAAELLLERRLIPRYDFRRMVREYIRIKSLNYTTREPGERPEDWVRAAAEAPLLILDNWYRPESNDFAGSIATDLLAALLEERFHVCAPTIFTSQARRGQYPTFGGRLTDRSRVLEVMLNAPNYRMRL